MCDVSLREGLLVAVKYQDQEQGRSDWYRARIVTYDDTQVTVHFIDYGTTSKISDSLKIKEISGEFARLPVQAIKLSLLVRSLEEEDITESLMLEELYSEERSLVVRISSLGAGGTVEGHLEVEQTGEIVYRSLLREGLLQLVQNVVS